MQPKQSIETALSFHENGDFSKALNIYTGILEKDSNNFQVLNLMGLLYQQLNNDHAALATFEKALIVQNNYFLTYYNAGASALKIGEFAKALKYLNLSISLNPQDNNAYTNKGIALHKLGQMQESFNSYKTSIRIKADTASAHFNLACLLRDMTSDKAINQSIQSFQTSITINPADYASYINLGNVMSARKKFDLAISLFKHSIAINSSIADAYFNLGTTQFLAKSYQESLESLKLALKINPFACGYWNNLGNAYKELSHFNNAIESYDRALDVFSKSTPEQKSTPDAKHLQAEALYNKGIVQHHIGLFQEAKISYDQSLEFLPGFTKALHARALTLKHLKLFRDAIADFKALITIDPHYEYALGNLIHTQMHCADWSDWNNYVNAVELQEDFYKSTDGITVDHSKVSLNLLDGIRLSKMISHPFPVLALYDDPKVHLHCAKIWVNDKHPKPSNFKELTFAEKKTSASIVKSNNRIKIAYLSADFHNHATAYLMSELFEVHNTEKYEIFALSFGPTTADEMQIRIKNAVEHFIDVKDMSDLEVANFCRSREIDIAVDLKGFTLDSRFNIFVYRCAPIQVSYLGFPGTSGSSCIDYLISDRVCIPPEYQSSYSEKIVYLPNCYQVNDSKRLINSCYKTRQDHGLPESGFVFCCFNNTYKITPPVFANWMILLEKVRGSVLWLMDDTLEVTSNLRRQAQSRGISPERLVFAKRMPLADHLGRHIHADLFLDTLPYNAHTTTSDALWAGLPVLTQMGKGFAGRVAASLLTSVGLKELITDNVKDYIELALELAENPKRLEEIRTKLAKAKTSSPLFNSVQFTRDLEQAYIQMVEALSKGLKPSHIYI